MTDGPLAKNWEAGVRYIVGWIENRLINITKSNQRAITMRSVTDLTGDSSDEETQSDDEDVSVSDDIEEEVCNAIYIYLYLSWTVLSI